MIQTKDLGDILMEDKEEKILIIWRRQMMNYLSCHYFAHLHEDRLYVWVFGHPTNPGGGWGKSKTPSCSLHNSFIFWGCFIKKASLLVYAL